MKIFVIQRHMILTMKETPRKKIVVVDDDEFIRKTFFLIFHENYDVYLAKDGEEDLGRFQQNGVDLIISDLRLPKLNGMEMIARFREGGYEGKIILISAFPVKVDGNELRRLAVECFFSKPLDLDALTKSVGFVLETGGWNEKGVVSI